jgi:hypothetical protein
MLKDETPPQRFNPYSLISGHFRKFIRNRVTGGGTERKIRVGSLLLYSKRLFPSFTSEMVREKVAEFSTAISRPEPTSLPLKRKMFLSIQDTLDEFCPPGEKMVADYCRPFPPSVSACHEYSRTDGGLQGYIRDFPLSGFLADPHVQKVLDLWRLTETELVEDDLVGGTWARMLRQLILEAVDELGLPDVEWKSILVGATGLTEPLKVRIVTKAEWFVQLLVPVQKAWHGKMRRHPVFQLIGGVPVFQALDGLTTGKGEKVVSGDYKSATDNIFLSYTREACLSMLERTEFLFPPGTPACAEPFIRKLAVHSLDHCALDLKGVREPIPITRGQMMGHILSFPLLCVINRAASCMAIPRSRFMRINGDDVIFPANKSEYRRWQRSTAVVGLEFSLGKNYYTNRLALVNSEYCVFNKLTRRWTPITVPNVGLLNTPVDKLVDDTGRQILPWEQLAMLFREFTSTSDSKSSGKYLSMFRKYYPILKNFPGPLYGPTEYGCFGARVPSPNHRFTNNQLMWMNAHRLGEFSFTQGTRNVYSKICRRYEQLATVLTGGEYVFGPADHGMAFGPPGLPDIELLGRKASMPDPYLQDMGLGSGLMALRRWFEDLSSVKHVRIFGARRWRQYLLSKQRVGEGIAPLPANYLHKVLQNSVWAFRPVWHRKRDLVGVRYEDDASYLHEIFQAQPEEDMREETTL